MSYSTFLVGGAVRDGIMGGFPVDRDYVIVGATPELMEADGYICVGESFPVFMHPNNPGAEFALARTEYKNGNGYKGFKVAFGTEVTLEDDLSRRDLTINAIALGEDGTLHDPFGGVEDIKNKVLRATSEAFKDDPLRVFRLARFYAKFPDFKVHWQTKYMAMQVVNSDDFKTLSTERVGMELIKVLETTPAPWRFFKLLAEIGGLKHYFPEIHALIGQTQPEQWHPEGDAFEHTLLVLRYASICNMPVEVKFAALVHDLGKGLTPKDKLPHHYGHEAAGVEPTGNMVDRLSLGNDLKKFGQYIAKFHMHVHKAMSLKPFTYVKVFEQTPRDEPMKYVVALTRTSICDARGRGPVSENDPYHQANFFGEVMKAISLVKVRDIMTEEEIKAAKPEKIKDKLRRARASAAAAKIKELKKDNE